MIASTIAGGIVAEQLQGERRVARPADSRGGLRANSSGICAGRFVAERDKIDRLAPFGRFLGAARRHHLADDGRQQRGRMLPADQVEALERLVDEVERVSAVGEGPFGLGREQGVGERGGRKTGSDPREQGALGRLAMANLRPAPQPALERGRFRPASERRAFPPRRLPVAVRRHAARPVEQGEIGLVLGQIRAADWPSAVRIVRPTPQPSRFWAPNSAACRTTSAFGTPAASWPCTALAMTRPMSCARPSSSRSRQCAAGSACPKVVFTQTSPFAQLDRAGRRVVRPQIEGAAAFEVEAGVVPVAGQDPVLDAAPVEREAHVGAAVVEREDAAAVVDDEDRAMGAVHDESAFRLQLFEAPCKCEVRVRHVHERTSRNRRFRRRRPIAPRRSWRCLADDIIGHVVARRRE